MILITTIKLKFKYLLKNNFKVSCQTPNISLCIYQTGYSIVQFVWTQSWIWLQTDKIHQTIFHTSPKMLIPKKKKSLVTWKLWKNIASVFFYCWPISCTKFQLPVAKPIFKCWTLVKKFKVTIQIKSHTIYLPHWLQYGKVCLNKELRRNTY